MRPHVLRVLGALAAWPMMGAVSALSCTGQVGGNRGDGDGDNRDGGEKLCDNGLNQPPQPPAITAPEPGRLDVIAHNLVVRSSAFIDPHAGGTHVGSEFEIWRVAANDEPVIRVWAAATDDSARLTEVRLADGTFEVGETLEPWTDYGVRARYRDAGECSAWGAWSDPRRFRTDDGSTAWFDPDTIHDVRIEVPPSSWDPIDDQAVPPSCVPHARSYYPGSVTIDGHRFDGVGLRTKGGCGTSRDLGGKAGWKINLSWADPAVADCPAERRIHGLKRLTFNNMNQDRSFVHERLAYRFYQLMGVPTPRANHARVSVNGELWGLYLNLETIDRRFLSRWFDSKDGMLYEGTYRCDLLPENLPSDDTPSGDPDDHCITGKFHPSLCAPLDPDADAEDYSHVRRLATALEDGYQVGAFYPEIEALIDFDTFLSMWAVENIIGHWDGYVIDLVNNYRIYHDPSTDRWTIIPTGVDQTFRTKLVLGEVTGLLGHRCWHEEDCRAAYLDRVGRAIDVFEAADLAAYAESIRRSIAQAVTEDPRKEGSVDDFDNGVDATLDFIADRPAEIRANLDR